MSSMYRTANNKGMCICGKISFDKKTAVTKKNSLERLGNEKELRVYQCLRSDWWHLTKQR